MKRIKICFSYKHVEKPWGGANNFIRALYNKLMETNDFELIDNIDDEYDILFMNQLSKGPFSYRVSSGNRNNMYEMKVIKRLIAPHGRGKKLVVRAVNLLQHSHNIRITNYLSCMVADWRTIKLLGFADYVIFQSRYQKDFFRRHGYKSEKNIIIHNGADEIFNYSVKRKLPPEDKLRLVSVTMSPRKTKRHDLIAQFSELKNVEVVHFGNWPESIDKKKVTLKGLLPKEAMLREFINSHFLLHPAIKDPCPNVVFEAIYAGLPIIYNPDIGSSREIVQNNGLPLNESNLQETIEKAIINYDCYADNTLQTREHYSIGRAAGQYIDLFKKIAG